MDPTEGACCIAEPDVTVGSVEMVDVVAILDEVLLDGVEDAGGVGTDAGFILMSFFSTFPLFSKACKGSLFAGFVRISYRCFSLYRSLLLCSLSLISLFILFIILLRGST